MKYRIYDSENNQKLYGRIPIEEASFLPSTTKIVCFFFSILSINSFALSSSDSHFQISMKWRYFYLIFLAAGKIFYSHPGLTNFWIRLPRQECLKLFSDGISRFDFFLLAVLGCILFVWKSLFLLTIRPGVNCFSKKI